MDMVLITQTLRTRVGDTSGLNATLKFHCGDEGVVVIDGRAVPNTVDNADRDADCTIVITRDHLVAMLQGDLDPVAGFMTGKFRVEGDMSVALKLQRVL